MYSKFGVALACTHVIIHTVKSFLTSGTCEVFVLRFVKHRPVANMFSCLAIFVFKLFCVAIFNPPRLYNRMCQSLGMSGGNCVNCYLM